MIERHLKGGERVSGKLADKEKIEKLFESGVTGYRIAQEADLNKMTVWNMMNGKTDIDRMEFKNAITLTGLYDSFKEEGLIE